MKLLITPTSPYARKARIVILEKQIPCTMVTAIPWDDDPLVVQNNPLRRIPVLLQDDGTAIVDSRVICEYLDAQNDSPQLLPRDPDARLQAQARCAIAEGAMDSCLAIIMSGRVAPGMATEEWKSWLMNKVEGALDYFEKHLSASESPLDMANITVGCLLGMIAFRMPDYDWQSARPALKAYWQTLSQRSSFAQTIPSA